MKLTVDRIECLLVVEKAGGRMDHDAPELAPFCDDKSTLSKPDVFNQCHDAGWLISKHDNRTDASTVYLTEKGRTALTSHNGQPK